MTRHLQATMPRGRRRKRGGEMALPCLQGGLGVRRAPFPSQVRRGGSRPPLQGATLPRQPKEQQGKRPTTAKTRALLTGRSPSTKPAWSPKASATLKLKWDCGPANGTGALPRVPLSFPPASARFRILFLLDPASRVPTPLLLLSSAAAPETSAGTPLDLRSGRPPPTRRKRESQHRKAPPSRGRPCSPPPQFTPAKTALSSFSHLTGARRASSRCCGGSQRRADWANGAGHTTSGGQRVGFPDYRGHPATASIAKGLGLRGTAAPWLTGQPPSLPAEGGSFSPSPGAPWPAPR